MNDILEETKPEKTALFVRHDRASRYQPFPLTDVQRAYWLGRTSYFALGNIGCHVYFEFDVPNYDRGLFQAAWQKLIDRHDMLRAVIREDGMQQVLPHTPHYEIKNLNLRGADERRVQLEIDAIRDRMSHQVFSPGQWPLFELRTTELKDRTLLHLSLDLLFVDLWSMQILFDEWSQLALDRDTYLAPLEISFRDYVLTLGQQKKTESYRRAEEYWLSRLKKLPGPPRLPLAKSPSLVTKPKFVRREAVIEPELWRNLKSRVAKARLTPSGFVMAAFARILAVWSQSSHFILNTTVFQRASLHPEVYQLVGDFTSILLLEIHDDGTDPLDVLARRIGLQFRSDLEHRDYSGLQLMQELAKQGDPDGLPSMPVVFTSALAQSMPGWRSVDQFGEVAYGITQTPQVYLDHQVYQRGGSLHLTWDAVEELFPTGLLDDMFSAYTTYLRRLAQDDSTWNAPAESLVLPSQLAKRTTGNETAARVPSGLLHTPFLEQVRQRPNQTAVISLERRLTYAELNQHAQRLARRLRRLGASPDRLVAIVMEKGWEQIAAALAVLEAGAAYLPIDPDLPRERRWFLLRQGGAELVLTQPCVQDRLEWPAEIQCVTVEATDSAPDDADECPPPPALNGENLAYVIFTSGSTGEPKGVMIEHRSALNTVLDINERFGVGAEDRILALSSLSFDLSVYDIFGSLAAGATIVIPHATSAREPGDWAALLLREKVTIWNSVPALLDLLVDHVEGRPQAIGSSLRLVLLSGDWIPVGLADRVRALRPELRVISLGGATEASIWSICYPIGAIDPAWSSIPYGRALRNQDMHVLNEAMAPSPTWVSGHIYIGGIGLARGYWKDTEKTDAQFVRHPRTGKRLYRTGDLGRYLPDGNIEFLGREDNQVKLQGYRIELGEIEATLERHPDVKAAVVIAVGERAKPKHLAVHVVADNVSIAELTDYLRQKLPAYMVPAVWQKLQALPLSANGKVDRGALVVTATPREVPIVAGEIRGDVLSQIAALISAELKYDDLDPRQNLWMIGATSMDLVRVIERLEREFGFRPSFQEFFREPTVAGLARLVQDRESAKTAASERKIGTQAPARSTLELIVDPAARDEFRRARHGIRVCPPEWGSVPLKTDRDTTGLAERIQRRRAVRQFLPEPVPLEEFGSWLAELSPTIIEGANKYRYGSAGGCYSVQTYLHIKEGGIAGCPAGTYYYHPLEHGLVPLTLGAELDPAVHEPFTNRPTFEQARFSLFFVSQPAAIEPMYGDLAGRFSLLEAGAMAHAVESSAWQFGLGVCPIGLIDFAAIRALFHLEDGQELLHAHVGGLVAPLVSEAATDRDEGVI